MKTSNEYSEAIDRRVFEATPKHVFAAIAVSALTCGGDWLNDGPVADRIVSEWWTLYTNGIVPQKPLFPKPV